MNAINALLFTALGSVMEILPKAFPSWFPHTGADHSSTRALWLAIMGSLQITMGLGYIIRMQLLPAAVRLFSSNQAGESGSLALGNSRIVTGR